MNPVGLDAQFHRLLQRQILAHPYGDQLAAEHKEFLEAINRAYVEFDDDRRMLERSLELMSEELMERNLELAQEKADLRWANHFQSKIISGISNAILVLDEGGIIRYASARAERMPRRLSKELVGQPAIAFLDSAFHPRFYRRFLSVARSGRDATVEGEVTHGSQKAYVRVMLSRMSHPEEPVEIVAAVEDVTDRRMMRMQLNQAGKMAMLGEMASGVAHEINQPLTVVRLAAEMIAEETSGETRSLEFIADNARKILRMTDRAMEIIRQLRVFARGADPHYNPIMLNEVIMDSAQLVRERLRLHSIVLEHDLDPNLTMVLGTANQLGQVFINLVMNAADAMDEAPGSRPKRIVIKTTVLSGRMIEATVEDTGPGIPPDILDRIFEPFFTTKPTGKGTGLGLSISFGIVEAHGGHITAENLATGAIFRLRLPTIDCTNACCDCENKETCTAATVGAKQ